MHWGVFSFEQPLSGILQKRLHGTGLLGGVRQPKSAICGFWLHDAQGVLVEMQPDSPKREKWLHAGVPGRLSTAAIILRLRKVAAYVGAKAVFDAAKNPISQNMAAFLAGVAGNRCSHFFELVDFGCMLHDRSSPNAAKKRVLKIVAAG